MKKLLIIFAIIFPATIFGASVQKLSTPFWQFIYKGNGQFRIEDNSIVGVDTAIDVASNITGFVFSSINTNIINYGVEDNSPFIVWVDNDDGKGKLLAKPNKKNKPVAIQNFSIVISNSNFKKITIKVDKNSLLGKTKPIGGVIRDPFYSSTLFPAAIFVDGNVESINFNCDLYGSLIYAENIRTLKFKDAWFSSILVGHPDKFIHDVVIGPVTNRPLMAFKSGVIDKLIAGRIFSTIIMTGGVLPNCFMSDAPAAFASPLLAPKGRIGKLKAKEICAWGNYEEVDWFIEDDVILNRSSVVLSSEIKKFKVKNITTENSSVYIHGR